MKTNCSCGSKEKLSDFKNQLLNLSLLSKPDSLEAKAGRGSPSVCSSGLRGTDILCPLLGEAGCLPDTQMFFELSRNGERTAHFRCALTTQAGSAGSGAVLNGRTAPTTKRDFLPRRRSIKGPGNIPCGCSRNLSPPPPVLRCSASWKGDTGPTSETLPRRSSTFKRGPNLLGQAARSRPSGSPAGDRAGRALPALGRP